MTQVHEGNTKKRRRKGEEKTNNMRKKIAYAILEVMGAQYCYKNIANSCRYADIFSFLTSGRYTDIIVVVIIMSINEILIQTGMSKYRLQKLSGVPHATLSDLCSGKTQIEKCSGETLYRLAKALQVPMELFLESIMEQKLQQERMQLMREQSYEYGLPNYLQHDLDAYKEGLKHGSTLMDCLWSELYGSINVAEINDGAITPEHADYLRNKFLWR